MMHWHRSQDVVQWLRHQRQCLHRLLSAPTMLKFVLFCYLICFNHHIVFNSWLNVRLLPTMLVNHSNRVAMDKWPNVNVVRMMLSNLSLQKSVLIFKKRKCFYFYYYYYSVLLHQQWQHQWQQWQMLNNVAVILKIYIYNYQLFIFIFTTGAQPVECSSSAALSTCSSSFACTSPYTAKCMCCPASNTIVSGRCELSDTTLFMQTTQVCLFFIYLFSFFVFFYHWCWFCRHCRRKRSLCFIILKNICC